MHALRLTAALVLFVSTTALAQPPTAPAVEVRHVQNPLTEHLQAGGLNITDIGTLNAVALQQGGVAIGTAAFETAADYSTTAEADGLYVKPDDTTSLGARTLFNIASIEATSEDADPDSIIGAFFMDQSVQSFNDEPVWWTQDAEWALWYNSTAAKWWISGEVDSEGAGWESDTMTGEFLAMNATGTVTLTPVDVRFSELNAYVMSVENEVLRFQAPEGDRPVPGPETVGTIRYRTDTDLAVLEVIMQTGAETWDWIALHTENWGM